MSKIATKTPSVVPVSVPEKEVTEIIELATNDIEALARAFNLIAEVCENRENPSIDLDPTPRTVIN